MTEGDTPAGPPRPARSTSRSTSRSSTGPSTGRRAGRRAEAGPAVCVGVGPSGSGTAVRFAVDEALRHHVPLRLIHVVRGSRPVAGAPEDGVVLRAAARRARDLAAGAVEVSATVRPGTDVVETLATAARGAELLVLGRRRPGWVRRLTGTSTTDRLLGRADLPVAVVPDRGSVRTHPDVLVGVQDAVEAPGLLSAAAVEAEARGGRLRVVHCWWRGDGEDDHVAGTGVETSVTARASSLFGTVLDSLDLPAGTSPALEVHHGPPDEVLAALSRTAGLVVVGRHYRPWPPVSHLGPTTRRLVDRLGAPVLVVPITTHDGRRRKLEEAHPWPGR